jgi:hypothetical protein
MDNLLVEEYVNGFSQLDLGTTEVLVSSSVNQYLFDLSTESALDSQLGEDAPMNRAQYRRFIRINYCHLREHGIEPAKSMCIAILKYFSAQARLVSVHFSPDDYHVHYTEAIIVPRRSSDVTDTIRPKLDDETEEDYAAFFIQESAFSLIGQGGLDEAERSRNKRLFTDELLAKYDTELTDPNAPQNKVDIKLLSNIFPNLVCMLAFVFRSRGHHYLPEYDDIYSKLWSGCGYDGISLPLDFSEIFVTSLHAVYPLILDTFWLYCCDGNLCSGNLKKRKDCAPAGSAYVYSLRNGVMDVVAVFPQLQKTYEAIIARLNEVYTILRNDRWAGSINHTYYGVRRVELDESDYIQIASIVFGLYTEFAPNSPILKSRSLKKVSDNAPLIGAVLGTTLRALTRSEEYTKRYIEITGREPIVEEVTE